MINYSLLGGATNPAESENVIMVAHYHRQSLTMLNEAKKKHEALTELYERETRRIFRAHIRLGALTGTIAVALLAPVGLNLEKLPYLFREETQGLEGMFAGTPLLLGAFSAIASAYSILAAYSQRRKAVKAQEQMRRDYNTSAAKFEEIIKVLSQHYSPVYVAPQS